MAIKKLDPSARFKLICEFDDAIVNESPEELEALKTGAKDAEGKEILKPTRYHEYLEELDERKLKLNPSAKPTYFIIRCLTNVEMGELQEEFFEFDPKEKKSKIKGSQTKYFQRIFELGVVGIQDESGAIAKIDATEVGYAVMVNIGSAVSIFTQLGKHSKKF